MIPVEPAAADVEELDRRFVFHPFTQLDQHERTGSPSVIVKGSRARLTDIHSRSYIDAMAGLWCVNVGYGRPEIAETLKIHAERLGYYHSFSSMGTDTPALLAERLIALAPAGMSKVFYGCTGSDANDTQVKIAWYYSNVLGRPEKKKIIARQRGYHGVTVMSGGLTGLPGVHANFDLPLPMIRHTTAPHRLWEAEPGQSDEDFAQKLADDLEALILHEGPDTVAAFIAEPIQGAGGVLVPPAGYFEKIQAVLRRHDVLLITDEVITGFGRLGKWFGSEVFGIEPDLITVAKSIAAGLPLSGVLGKAEIVDAAHDGAIGGTYVGNPVAQAAALAVLDVIDDERLVERANAIGETMRARMLAWQERYDTGRGPAIGEVRGLGAMLALELVEDRATKAPAPALAQGVIDAALKRGLLLLKAGVYSNCIRVLCPLVITDAELDEALAVWEEALAATLA